MIQTTFVNMFMCKLYEQFSGVMWRFKELSWDIPNVNN